MTKIGDVTDGLGFKVGELHTDDSSELAGCLASLIMWLVVAAVALAVWLLVVCVKLTWRLIKATNRGLKKSHFGLLRLFRSRRLSGYC